MVLLLLFTFTVGLFAQSTGTINGRVTDTSGAVVPGTTITATNTATGVARTTTTISDGLYNITGLLPGTYDIQASANGLEKVVKQGETLVTATTLTVNFELGVATTTQKAEVTAEAPLVDTTQSFDSQTLQTTEVQSLPILNRNFSGLVTLVPSARPTATPANNKIALGGGLGFSGGAGRNGGVEMDGAALRDDVNGGPLFNVTLEGVQEFNVLAHDYPANYGLTSGGIVLITTKSGGNAFHGSAFGFGRNQDMTAIDYFSKPSNGGLGKPPYDREEFGGSLGGPIKKDKLFFFVAAEDLRLNQSLVIPNLAYSQAVALKSNLSSLTSCPICVTVGNAMVPSSNLPETIRDLQTNVRMDYQINDKNSFFARYVREHLDAFDDILQTLGGVPHPDINPNGSNVYDPVHGDNAVISWTSIIGTRSVNTLAFAGTNFYEFQYCKCSLTGPAQMYADMIFPDLQVGAPVPAAGSKDAQTDIQVKELFSHQLGNHSLKFGGDYIDYLNLGYLRNISGDVAFFDDPTTIINNTNGKYPEGFLTPGAMKTVLEMSKDFGGAPAPSAVENGKEFSLFAQDDWKIKSNLTLNLGVHYDRYSNFYDQSGDVNNRAYLLLHAIGSPWGSNIPKTFNKAISPRVGLAWDITKNGKNVFRASFGIFYDESLSPNMTAIDPENQPLLENVGATYTNTAVGAGAAPTTVYGGVLPLALQPGLPTFLPGGNTTITWLEPGTVDPSSEQTHAGYTRQISPTMVFSLDYTHMLGLHEWHAELINPLESTAWDPNAASYNTCGITGSYRRLECAFRAAGLAPNTIGVVQINSATNRSQYNEAVFHFAKRSKYMDFQANYILSAAYAFGGAIGSTATGGGPVAAEIPLQIFSKSEWGPSLTDERNRVVVSGVFRLKWGIEAAPIFQWGSARPYNCLSSTDYTGSGNGDSRCVVSSATGAITAAPAVPAGTTVTTSGGYTVNGVTYTPLGVNALRGTDTYDLDARFSKIFTIHERYKLAAFVELYNITNKANFGNNYGGTYSATSTTFEKPLGYLNNGVSLPTSRQLQLGARFTF